MRRPFTAISVPEIPRSNRRAAKAVAESLAKALYESSNRPHFGRLSRALGSRNYYARGRMNRGDLINESSSYGSGP
jgi:hypothetical protein